MRNFLVIFFFLSLSFACPTVSFAKQKQVDLQKIYGEDLGSNIPPLVRLKYQNDTGKSWGRAGYEEREEFLAKWQAQRQADIEADKADQKAIAAKKKEEAVKARIREREKRNEEKKLIAKEKTKEEEKKAADKKTDNLVKTREDKIKNLIKANSERNKH